MTDEGRSVVERLAVLETQVEALMKAGTGEAKKTLLGLSQEFWIIVVVLATLAGNLPDILKVLEQGFGK
jgi:hypothetical protein